VQPGVNSNLWGLPAPKSWVEEATSFADLQVGAGPDSVPMTAERFLAEKKPEAVMG
jgi:hypothetical protein